MYLFAPLDKAVLYVIIYMYIDFYERNLENEMNIKIFIAAFVKHIVWLIMVPLVCACLTFAVTSFEDSDYTAKAEFLSKNNTDEVDYLSPTLQQAQKSAIADYIKVLMSDTTLKRVSQNLQTKYGTVISVSELRSMISASQNGDTSTFTVYVTCDDPRLAETVAKGFSNVFAFILEDAYKKDDIVQPLSKEFNAVENKPDLIKPSVIVAALGFVVTFAICFLIAYFDKTVRSVAEAKTLLGVPVIGAIPTWKND